MEALLPEDAQEEIPTGYAIVGHIGMLLTFVSNDTTDFP